MDFDGPSGPASHSYEPVFQEQHNVFLDPNRKMLYVVPVPCLCAAEGPPEISSSSRTVPAARAATLHLQRRTSKRFAVTSTNQVVCNPRRTCALAWCVSFPHRTTSELMIHAYDLPLLFVPAPSPSRSPSETIRHKTIPMLPRTLDSPPMSAKYTRICLVCMRRAAAMGPRQLRQPWWRH